MKMQSVRWLMPFALAAAGSAQGADYAREALVARWDAVENVAAGTHDGTAGKWIDLVGGRAFELRKVSVGARALAFAGAKDSYAVLDEKTARELFAKCAGDVTVECAFRPDGPADPKECGVVVSSAPARRFSFGVGADTAFLASSKAKKMNAAALGEAIAGRHVTVAVHAAPDGKLSVWRDGRPLAVEERAGGLVTDPCYGELFLGCRRDNDAFRGAFKGEISAVRVYARKLTDAELAANAKLDAARFRDGKVGKVHTHAWGAWTTNSVATCETPFRRTRTCAAAGCKAVDADERPALGHDWGWGYGNRTKDGKLAFTCRRCRKTETRPLPAGRPAAGDNALRVTVKPVENRMFAIDVYRAGTNVPHRIALAYPDRGPHRGGVLVDEARNIGYSERVGRMRAGRPMPKSETYPRAYVSVDAKGWFGFSYSMLPYFFPDSGFYRHDRVVRDIDAWLAEYPLYPERTFSFEFRYDAATGRLEGYLDGSYAGVGRELPGAGPIDRVEVLAAPKAEVAFESFRADFGELRKLDPILRRANPALRAGAKLELDPKMRAAVEKAVAVWKPEVSIDQGRHGDTHAVRELCSDPQSSRTPFVSGPEFMQWIVPNAFYRAAYVLCAEIPQPGRVPKVGVSLTRFGTSNVGSRTQSFVSLEGAATNRSIRAVGTLSYRRDGKAEKATVYLVKVPINPLAILQYVNDLPVYGKDGKGRLPRMLGNIGDYLDFEFVGAGTGDWNPRSSVQILGCSLAQMDYGVEMDQSVRGNLFERGTDRPETGVKVTAAKDGAKGRVRWTTYDPLCRTLASGTKDFALAKKGDVERLSFDLEQKDVGWYGIDFTFEDEKGDVIGTHEASYTILAPDDREWGCDSPYAAWPLGGGYHNSDPNRRQQAVVMRKAGYRGSWQPPVTNENEFGWPLTQSNVGLGHCNPGGRRSAEQLAKDLDKTVAHIRETRRRFPSCRYIQLLHEQGGRDVDACLYDPKKACARGAYKGIDGDWDVYFCTEYAKRMRREFPDMKIFIGNGSVSSEKVADLVRRGFDLSLVDQLGIESKGFGTMPELACHREAPGCLWALGETGRYFGYSNLTLNACNEYVFRPERRVNRNGSPNQILQVANYAVRDYILSLAHGCGIISHGHLEDCNDAYYDTNWGCGGQCTFYPFSYPKRMYTGIAVFTRVMDRATLSRVVPTGGNATYALEFRRDRRSPDYAYVLWTQQFPVKMALEFPSGAKVRAIDFWGVEKAAAQKATVEVGPSPRYFISDRPLVKATLPPSELKLDGGRYVRLAGAALGDYDARNPSRLAHGLFNVAYGTPTMPSGTWNVTQADDPEVGEAIEFELVRKEPAPSPLLWEAGEILLAKPVTVKAGSRVAVLFRGNGGCGAVALGYYSPARGPAYSFGKTFVNFDGWRLVEMTAPTHHINKKIDEVTIQGVMFGTGRKALNPVEMADVKGRMRFGGIFLVNGDGGLEKLQDADRRGSEVMKRDVSDKDL